MKLGVAIDDTWAYFKDFYNDLNLHHQVTVFKPRSFHSPIFRERINQFVYNREYTHFLQSNQVVFFEWATGLLQKACQFPKMCGMVTRIHRYEMYNWVEQINWEPVDKIIVVSNAKKREFIARAPEQAHKLVVIPEAISLEKFQSTPKQFSGDIGILCHLSPRKRVYELILAFNELVLEGGNYHLHIGGGKRRAFLDYHDALVYLVRALNLEDKVTFYGNVKNAREWYNKIDIFVSNSYSEGLQVSPMEAIASGCYCLSHQWDGAEELLPADNLYLTDSELIGKIKQYAGLSQTEQLQKITDLQSIVHEQFNTETIKAQIRQVIEEVGASMIAQNGNK